MIVEHGLSSRLLCSALLCSALLSSPTLPPNNAWAARTESMTARLSRDEVQSELRRVTDRCEELEIKTRVQRKSSAPGAAEARSELKELQFKRDDLRARYQRMQEQQQVERNRQSLRYAHFTPRQPTSSPSPTPRHLASPHPTSPRPTRR